MTAKSYLRELQHIECDLASGVKTLGQTTVMLSEEDLPNHYYDSLYVIYTYMRNIHKDLLNCIHDCERSELI